ncbi:type II toxin-antitoxin system PemI/MazE family antitoxin [Loigolactobacillus binensis]|uniref:Type II toxin-antitoxin system PemI/MazE family antitoxin n=1 Tax=Loigolactobacillus binensis TaxID=2559922 RepID=A0ABW3ED56_9LACO|nr:hypothetical protein [Loigolactobacillus binensis]
MSKSLGLFSTRKTGNSLTLTVPRTSGVSAGQEFELIKEDDGTLCYRPRNENPWSDGLLSDHDFRNDLLLMEDDVVTRLKGDEGK